MNNKGQVIFYTLMLATVIVIFAIAVAPVMKTFVDEARAPSSDTAVGLNCTSDLISDYDKATCLAVDINFPFIILCILALAGTVIGSKVLLE